MPAFVLVSAVMLLLLVMPALDVAGAEDPFAPILLPSTLVFPVVLYSVAAWCQPRTSRLALAGAGVGSLLVLARLWGADYLTVTQPGLATRDDPVRSLPLFVALGVVAAVVLPWGLGRYRRLRAQYVIELEERARREEQDRVESARHAAAEERTRIAREMHDVVAHSLSVMVSQAEGGRLMAQRDPSVTLPVLETVARVGQEAMRDMHSLLQALHEDEPPGIQTPQPGLGELPHLLERVRGVGLSVSYTETGDRLGLSGAGELAAYRVTQEALTNVLKHAGGDGTAQVRLDWQPGAPLPDHSQRPGQRDAAPGQWWPRGVRDDRTGRRPGRTPHGGSGRGRSVHGQCRDTDARLCRGGVVVTIRVVLVDDQDLVRAGLAMIVESQDDLKVVGQAGDGAAAIEAVRKTSPDVVLMDVRMPGMDGIEATGRDPAGIPTRRGS